jgi:TPR repeat protein
MGGDDAMASSAIASKLQVDHLYALGLAALRNRQFEQAANTLALAASRGHARAQLHYGVLCEHGIGVPVNIERARLLYQEAGAMGDVDARFRLQVLDLVRVRFSNNPALG